MPKKNLKNNFFGQSRLCMMLMAGAFCVLAGRSAYGVPMDAAVDLESQIAEIRDPFDVKTQAPELFEAFIKTQEPLIQESAAVFPEPMAPEPELFPEPELVASQEALLPVPKLPAMAVTGILYMDKTAEAIINGQVVGRGDVVDGAQVIGISRGRIDLRYMDIDHVIYFNNE